MSAFFSAGEAFDNQAANLVFTAGVDRAFSTAAPPRPDKTIGSVAPPVAIADMIALVPPRILTFNETMF